MKFSLKTIWNGFVLGCGVLNSITAHRYHGTWWATAFWVLMTFNLLTYFLESLAKDLGEAA